VGYGGEEKNQFFWQLQNIFTGGMPTPEWEEEGKRRKRSKRRKRRKRRRKRRRKSRRKRRGQRNLCFLAAHWIKTF
jgi:hypothetical protein